MLRFLLGRISEEMPMHIVIHRTPTYEIWKYTTASISACVYANDFIKSDSFMTHREFTSVAFDTLARYIGVFTKPENLAVSSSSSSEEAIAMTAPVVMDPPTENIAMTAPVIMGPSTNQDQGAVGASMKFILPSKYSTIDKTPKPTNPLVRLERIEGDRFEAVFRFNGNFNIARATEKAIDFMQILDDDKVKILDRKKWTAQGYNPPFTLPMLKRNEIHVPLDPEGLKGKT